MILTLNTLQENYKHTDFAIIGGGGHAKVIAATLRELGLRIVGHTALEKGASCCGEFLGTDDVLAKKYSPRDFGLVMGIGLPGVMPARFDTFQGLKSLGYDFPPIIALGAMISSDVQIGDGTVVLNGSNVAPGSRVGQCCILNHMSSTDHDCRVGNNAHLAPGAILCGDVTIGNHTIVGAGAVLLPGVTINDQQLVKAGSTIK